MNLDFLITSLIVVISPGTGVLFTLATGLSRGSHASIVAAFGCTLGIVPHMAAAILGLAALLHASALAFQALKILGVAYLLYMAWHTLRERGALQVEPEIDARSAVRVTVTAILINILNPKLSIFFLAFLPQFISASEPEPLWRMLALSGVFMLMTFVVFVGYGLFAASVRDHVISRRRNARGARQNESRARAPGREALHLARSGTPAPASLARAVARHRGDLTAAADDEQQPLDLVARCRFCVKRSTRDARGDVEVRLVHGYRVPQLPAEGFRLRRQRACG